MSVCHAIVLRVCVMVPCMQGLTCAQFQELPPEQRTKDDAALFHLSNKNKWRQCPSCKNMVERSDGCNYIKCRCGKGFCFQCGVAYKSNKPTAKNNHGEMSFHARTHTYTPTHTHIDTHTRMRVQSW